MKHPRRFLPLLLLAGSLFVPLALRADDDASHLAAATELLKVMHTDSIIDRVADQVSQSADRLMPPTRTSATPEEDAAFRTSLRKRAKDILQQQVNWPTLEPLIAQMYVGDFTEPEIKQLIEFYKTPIGQKLLDKQQDLATKFSTATQQKIRGVIPIITQELKSDIQKFVADHPAKSPPAAPTSSGAPLSAVSPPVPGGSGIAATPAPAPMPTASASPASATVSPSPAK